MTQPNTAAGLQWKWSQPEAFKRIHQMTRGDEVAATLSFGGMCGSLATAESAHGRWTFKRGGFLSPRVTVRKAGETNDLAVFYPKWQGGGELRFTAGETYTLKSLNFWGGDWAFENQRGEIVVSLHGPHGFLKSAGEIEVGAASDHADVTLLAILGWYLRLLMLEDAAATAVIIS